jgi:N-acetylneuraminate lyase
MIQILLRGGLLLSASKLIMKMLGMDCGPVRAPLVTMTADQAKRLENDLRALGFFDWIAK